MLTVIDDSDLHPSCCPELVVGQNLILRHTAQGQSLAPLWAWLTGRAEDDPDDGAALWDISQILLARGHLRDGLRLQADALRRRRDFRIVHGDGSGPVVLAFMAPGDLSANLPADLLLHGSNATLWLRYVGDDDALTDLPRHDKALIAAGPGAAADDRFQRLAAGLNAAGWPLINGNADAIAGLTPERLGLTLGHEDNLVTSPAPTGNVRHRIALIDGQAFALERDGDDVLARHADRLVALTRRIGLDCFDVECGETRDGRLAILSADVAGPSLALHRAPNVLPRLCDAFMTLINR